MLRYGEGQSNVGRDEEKIALYVVNAALCGNYYAEMAAYAGRLRKAGIKQHKLVVWHDDERISERVRLMAAGHLDLDVVSMTNEDVEYFREMLPLRSILLMPSKEQGRISHVWLQSSAIDDGLRNAVLKQVE